MDAGGWVMDAGTRPISRVGRRDVRCGSARCLVVARQDLYGGKEQGRRPSAASTKRGRPPSAAVPPLWFPCSLPPQRSCLATTRHLALPQRTSRLATREIRRIASQRRMDVPMLFGHNSTLAAPFGASMGGIDIIFQRASFWICPRYLV